MRVATELSIEFLQAALAERDQKLTQQASLIAEQNAKILYLEEQLPSKEVGSKTLQALPK